MLALDTIVIDKRFQPRASGLNESHVEDLMEAYQSADADIEPPRVFTVLGTGHVLTRGFHRHEALKRLGRKRVECEIKNGSVADAITDAAGSNIGHGLKRTNKDKRRSVEMIFDAHPDWSNKLISDAAGVGDDLVKEVRQASESETSKDEKPSETKKRTGTDGKKYTVKDKPKADTKSTQVSEAPTPETGSEPVRQSEPEEPDNGTEGQETACPPSKDSGRDDDDPQPDPRFMSNADEAAKFVGTMKSLKMRLDSVRAEFRRIFPDRKHLMARRVDAARWEAGIGELIETIDNNVPECVCPPCFGQGIDPETSAKCKYCDGYGIVDKGHHSGLKARWKRTRSKFDDLVRRAETGDKY